MSAEGFTYAVVEHAPRDEAHRVCLSPVEDSEGSDEGRQDGGRHGCDAYRTMEGLEGALGEPFPGEDLRASHVPCALLAVGQAVDAERREIGAVNGIDPGVRAEEEDAALSGHLKNLGHVGEVPGGIDDLTRYLGGCQFVGESGLCPGQLCWALIASDDVDEAEVCDAVCLRGAKDGEIGPVINVPGIGFLSGDPQGRYDVVDSYRDICDESGIRDLPDSPVVDEAIQ